MKAHRVQRGASSAGGRVWMLVLAVALVGAVAWYWRARTESDDARSSDSVTAAMRQMMANAAAEDPNPVRPSKPPVPGRDEPFSLPEPQPPPDMNDVRAKAYAEAAERGDPHPAEAAFRKAISAFVEYNRQFADAQAQKEGLTLDEVKELTYFGFLAQQTQRWPEVEQILGQPVDAATRSAAEQLLHELNAEFKASMRSLVSSGATADQRWQLIRDVQARYREAYYATTGMNETLLQDLLAGDLGRKYPMSQTPPPEKLAEQAPAPAEPKPRPDDEPPSRDRPGDGDMGDGDLGDGDLGDGDLGDGDLGDGDQPE